MAIGSSYESDEIGLMAEALETAQQLVNARAEIRRLRNLKAMSDQELTELYDACAEEISRRDQQSQ